MKTFEGKAEEYTAGRPAYAEQLLEDLYSQYELKAASVIADIGSGTGKFAKQLLARGSEVYGVEPSEDMRLMAERELQEYNRFHSVRGNAAHTGLEENQVDHITSAQAFHWFDVAAFKKECQRIIKPGGRIFLIWNIRDNASMVNQKWSDVFSEFCPDFTGFSGGLQRDDRRIKEFFDGRYDRIEYAHPLFFTHETFLARSLSSSYSIGKEQADYETYIDRLQQLFRTYAEHNRLKIENNTVLYTGTL